MSIFCQFAVEDKNPHEQELWPLSEETRRQNMSQTAPESTKPTQMHLKSNHDDYLGLQILVNNIKNLNEKEKQKLRRSVFHFFEIWYDFEKAILNQIIVNLLLATQADLINNQIRSFFGFKNHNFLSILSHQSQYQEFIGKSMNSCRFIEQVCSVMCFRISET